MQTVLCAGYAAGWGNWVTIYQDFAYYYIFPDRRTCYTSIEYSKNISTILSFNTKMLDDYEKYRNFIVKASR